MLRIVDDSPNRTGAGRQSGRDQHTEKNKPLVNAFHLDLLFRTASAGENASMRDPARV
jgi:hypothetical protein